MTPAQPVPARASIPRVLFVIPGDGVNPVSSMIFARRQAEALAELGADVEVFFLRSRTSPVALAREFVRFRRTIAEVRPEVIHAHYGTVTGVFAAAGAGRIPLVVTYRGSDLNFSPAERGLRPALGRLFSQVAALRADRIVCVSRQLRQRLWWRRNRATVLASAVDPKIFKPQPRATARQELGWPEDERVVLFNAGRDPRNKRLDLALAAAELARRDCTGLRLEVLDGSVDPRLLPVYMNACDCLLMTSDAEGSPTVVQEALAVNLPIVSVEVGDIPERLENVQNTRIVGRDPAALARALVELVRTPLRSNGRDHIGELRSERIADKLCEIYREAVEERRGGRPFGSGRLASTQSEAGPG
jgi:glycosyltransferase involved in cell wall biosynthesis